MAATFSERLREGPPLVADGGMGVLVSAAVPGLRCPEEANLRAPESVVSLHLGFIRAGADLVETNTFDQDGETIGGVHAADAAARLRPLGLAAIGANHGAGLQAALRALESMRGDGTPLAALPNVGLASISAGRIVYPHATPEYFAD